MVSNVYLQELLSNLNAVLIGFIAILHRCLVDSH